MRTRLIAGLLAAGLIPQAALAVVMDVSVAFNSNTNLYTYEYTVSGVGDGRKVDAIFWVVADPGTQPSYFPADWLLPELWFISVAGNSFQNVGVWFVSTGASSYSATGNPLLSGQSASFSFTTGYAPREGTYLILENAVGSEVNYNQIFGRILLPNYTGTLIETAWSGGPGCSTPGPCTPDLAAVPIPATLPLFATGLGVLGLIGWRRKRKGEARTAS